MQLSVCREWKDVVQSGNSCSVTWSWKSKEKNRPEAVFSVICSKMILFVEASGSKCLLIYEGFQSKFLHNYTEEEKISGFWKSIDQYFKNTDGSVLTNGQIRA